MLGEYKKLMEEAITIYHTLRDIGKTFCIFTGFEFWHVLAPENLRRVRSVVSSTSRLAVKGVLNDGCH